MNLQNHYIGFLTDFLLKKQQKCGKYWYSAEQILHFWNFLWFTQWKSTMGLYDSLRRAQIDTTASQCVHNDDCVRGTCECRS